jgi:hypothetical protein
LSREDGHAGTGELRVWFHLPELDSALIEESGGLFDLRFSIYDL